LKHKQINQIKNKMAIMRKKEIPRLNESELIEKLKNLKLEMLKIKAQKGQATAGSKKLNELRKSIARINTQLNQLKK